MTILQSIAGVHDGPCLPESDLAGQMSLLERAHASLATGVAQQALELSRRYVRGYPVGLFRMEADAVTIHALVMLGRTAEAGVLAERFVLVYGKSPLAKRLRRLAA